MFITESKTNRDLFYVFESKLPLADAERCVPDYCKEELASNPFIKKGALDNAVYSLEQSLELDKARLPIGSTPAELEKRAIFKKIMKDCAHPELKAAYEDSYDAMMRFLRLMGVDDKKSYRIHTVKRVK